MQTIIRKFTDFPSSCHQKTFLGVEGGVLGFGTVCLGTSGQDGTAREKRRESQASPGKGLFAIDSFFLSVSPYVWRALRNLTIKYHIVFFVSSNLNVAGCGMV